jgi:dethiobiotin synthetase
LQIDQVASWELPVILCARTGLGTINHTLLCLEALAKRAMRVHGVVFIGNPDKDVERTIARVGSVRSLGRLPIIEPLNAARLAEAFRANFDLRDFGGTHG